MNDTSPADVAAFDKLVRTRRSVRGFLDKPVPDDVMQQIFETARWSPSGTNVQPWQICVASGATRDKLRQGFLERIEKGEPINTDHVPDGKVGDLYRERKRACARSLYGSMDIAWEDREARRRAYERNYELFDAPHVAFFGIHEIFGPQTIADVGMYTQTLMLAMTAHGVGCCAQGNMRNYPDFVRDVFGLPNEIKILYGVSFGYEDLSVPANAARTERAPLSETVQFMN